MNILNEIFSVLMAGQVFHMRSAEQTRKLGLEGWASWHVHESEGDFNYMKRLSILMTDKLKFDFNVDVTQLTSTHEYKISSITDLQSHHQYWYDRENNFCTLLKKAIEEVKYTDVEIYNLLLEKLNDVQTEMSKIDNLNINLTNVSYSPMMLNFTSKELKEYYSLQD